MQLGGDCLKYSAHVRASGLDLSRQRVRLYRIYRTNLELKFAVRWGLTKILSPCETLRLGP